MMISNMDGVRPRRTPTDAFRKQNYWTTQTKPEPPPWYVWDNKLPISRSRSEANLPAMKTAPSVTICDAVEIRKDMREYLMTSTLHGLRYIGEKKLTWLERFFWLAAFGSSLVCAAFFILNVYAKWRLTPMIVSVNPENMPLLNLPFPALTICNVNQAKRSVAERYNKEGRTIDKKMLQSLCSTEDEADADIFEETESADWDHLRQFLINVTQPCTEMILECKWNSKLMSCSDLFNAQPTDEGLCCTFNVVHKNFMFWNPKSLNDMNITFPSPSVDWTPEGGYPPDSPVDGFPLRPKGVGTHRGLSLILDANVAEYYCASTKSAGFKILLHNPVETPKIANLGEIYGPGVEARVAIQPRILDAQPALRSIEINKRLCVFSSEKTLVFFRTYTLKNCEMECEAQQMLDACSCVMYYMPKNRTTRVCGKSDAKCYTSVWKNSSLVQERICDECLPACTEISYNERMSTASLDKYLVEHFANALDNRTAEYFVENMLVVHLYFEDGRFQRYTKGEIFGLTEFLSNTGGLLGLCMGFSVMSAVELLYFCTLRALCMARRRRPKPFTK